MVFPFCLPTVKATGLTELYVDGTEIKDGYGNTVVLKGVNIPWFLGDSDGSFMGNTVWNEANVAAEFAILRSWNCNVVRFPLAVDIWKTNSNNGGQYMHYAIDRVLTLAEEAGLYVLINPHVLKSDSSYSPKVASYQNPLPYPPNQDWRDEPEDFTGIIASKAEFVDHMEDLAQTTMNHSNVMWGLWNEPQGNSAALLDYYGVAQDCIDAIRALGATQLIFVMGENWGSPSVDLDSPPGDGLDWFSDYGFTDATGNLVIDTHNYRGHIHEGAVSSYTYADLSDGYNYLDYFNQTYPVVVTEIGANYLGGTTEEQYFDNSLTLFDENGLGYIAHVFSEQTSYRMHTGYPSCTPNTGGTIFQDHVSSYSGTPTVDSVVFYDGFESGNFSAWTNITSSESGNTPNVISSSPYNGTYKGNFTTSGGGSSSVSKVETTPLSNATWSFYVYLGTRPGSGNLLYVGTLYGTDSEYVSVIITNTGGSYYWGMRYSTTSYSETTASNPAIGTWYHVELYRDNVEDLITLTVDDVVKKSSTLAMTEDTEWAEVGISYSSEAATVYIDDATLYSDVEDETEPPLPTATPTPAVSSLSVSINTPLERKYTRDSFNASITSVNATVVWYNVVNVTSGYYVYGSNMTYTAEVALTGFADGSYVFYAWATDGTLVAEDIAEFSVDTSSGLPSLNMDAFWLFLYEGNFLGGVQAYLVTSFLNIQTAIALICMLFLVPLYLRTKSLMLICILWILLGGFFIAAMPMASGLAMIFMVLGAGGMVWRLFRGGTSY